MDLYQLIWIRFHDLKIIRCGSGSRSNFEMDPDPGKAVRIQILAKWDLVPVDFITRISPALCVYITERHLSINNHTNKVGLKKIKSLFFVVADFLFSIVFIWIRIQDNF